MTSTTPRVIGLWSPTPGCGKSTVASLIQELDWPGCEIIPFADALKDMLAVLLLNAGYTERQAERALWDPEGKTERLYFLPGMPTGRQLMQTLGTEWGRYRVHPDLWTTIWRAKVRNAGMIVIADDVRFPNEAQAIRDVGGELWCIRSPLGQPAGEHISEGQLGDEPFNVIINNNGTLEQLRTAVHHALKRCSPRTEAMSNQQHPITPPSPVIDYLNRAVLDGRMDQWDSLDAAYRAGADAELEACCEWVSQFSYDDYSYQDELRATRRPKPPSLAEQGLEALDEMNKPLGVVTGRRCDTIRAALKRLQELEQRLD